MAAWAVLFAIGIAHLVPALLFAWQPAQGGTKGIGLAMVACAPLIGWTGFDALVLHGDWGDAVIWLPYLATGICLLLLGIISLARRIA